MFRGKVAVITGSTSGIGLGIAQRLARDGCDIILTGLGEAAAIAQLVADFEREFSGSKTHFVNCDLTDYHAIERFASDVHQLYPNGIHILVNNAGFQHVCPIDTFPPEVFEKMMAVMLAAPFHLTRVFVPKMRALGYGRIVNISSVHGLIASPGKSAYTAVKHGVIGLTKAVALDTATSHITCNAICPGFVDTDIAKAQVQALMRERNIHDLQAGHQAFLEKYHPNMSFVTIDEVAGLVAYLCSDEAKSVTGAELKIDGGYTVR